MSTPDLVAEKYCPHCKGFRPRSAFKSDRSKKDGRSTLCKAHAAARAREYYARDEVQRIKQRARISVTRHQWYKKTPGTKKAWYAWDVAKRMGRVPGWVKFKDTIPTYEAAAQMGEEFQVDHIYPYRGETVCGLHCPDNLRVLHKTRNIRKGNRMPTLAEQKFKAAQQLLKKY